MLKVWHRTNPTFGFDSGPVSFPGDFALVATVNTDSRDKAYELTNHIHRPWPMNDGVVAHVERARSTSVGDVVEDASGFLWLVAPVGWKPFVPDAKLREEVAS